jgi:hypothetical protein
MTQQFTTEQLAQLSQQVDAQLQELNEMAPIMKRAKVQFSDKKPSELPPKQQQVIEENAKETAESFLQKFVNSAKSILCSADSDLQKEYEVFGDLKKDALLEKLAGVLAVMGFSGAALQMLTVAITVYILHIGVKTFSNKYCK